MTRHLGEGTVTCFLERWGIHCWDWGSKETWLIDVSFCVNVLGPCSRQTSSQSISIANEISKQTTTTGLHKYGDGAD